MRVPVGFGSTSKEIDEVLSKGSSLSYTWVLTSPAEADVPPVRPDRTSGHRSQWRRSLFLSFFFSLKSNRYSSRHSHFHNCRSFRRLCENAQVLHTFGDSRSSLRDKYEPADWTGLPFRLIRRLSSRPSVLHNCLIVFL